MSIFPTPVARHCCLIAPGWREIIACVRKSGAQNTVSSASLMIITLTFLRAVARGLPRLGLDRRLRGWVLFYRILIYFCL